jgi:hypothetical protein
MPAAPKPAQPEYVGPMQDDRLENDHSDQPPGSQLVGKEPLFREVTSLGKELRNSAVYDRVGGFEKARDAAIAARSVYKPPGILRQDWTAQDLETDIPVYRTNSYPSDGPRDTTGEPNVYGWAILPDDARRKIPPYVVIPNGPEQDPATLTHELTHTSMQGLPAYYGRNSLPPSSAVEIAPTLASIKRNYAAATGKLVTTPEEARKALEWVGHSLNRSPRPYYFQRRSQHHGKMTPDVVRGLEADRANVEVNGKYLEGLWDAAKGEYRYLQEVRREDDQRDFDAATLEELMPLLVQNQQATQKLAGSAVDAYIIKGNPAVIAPDAEKYERFYRDVASVLQSQGLQTAFDAGEPHTLPPGGRLWVGHSRGGSRLRYAPPGVATLSLDAYEPEESRAKQRAAYESLFKQLGVNTVADVPLSLRPKPGPEHYTLNDAQRTALLDVAKSLQVKQAP